MESNPLHQGGRLQVAGKYNFSNWTIAQIDLNGIGDPYRRSQRASRRVHQTDRRKEEMREKSNELTGIMEDYAPREMIVWVFRVSVTEVKWTVIDAAIRGNGEAGYIDH